MTRVLSSACGGNERAQSELIGIVLIFGLVILGATAVVVLGGSALTDAQSGLAVDRAEKSLAQLDSQTAMVAFGGGDTQSVALPTGAGEQYRIEEDRGWLKVTSINRSDYRQTIVNSTLGAVFYEKEDAVIAYQGGGVWRASDTGGTMVSPPEFHYRDGTLTLPVINITGSGHVGNSASIHRVGTAQEFPNATQGDWRNPIEDRKVNITVKSEYYQGWGSYFADRTKSTVEYDHRNNTVTASLVPPPAPVKVDAGVVASGDLELDGAANIDGPVSLGGETDDEADITGLVEENQTENTKLETAASKITAAETRLSGESAPASSSTVTSGSYYVNNDGIFSSSTEFDTSGGDIELFVDGDLEAQGGAGGGPPGGGGASPDLDITGDGTVKIYADGEFHMNGQPTWGKSSEVDSLYVYSHEVDRITEIYGVLYTDAISIQGAGGGGPSNTDLQGALVSTANSVDVSGQVKIEYDDALDDMILEEVDVEYATITFLHISEATIEFD